MENKLVFFGEQGLTLTSSNYICNIAKEKCEEWEAFINNLVFYTTKVSLIGTSEKSVVQIGTSDLTKIPEYLDKIAKAKSLIAWLRESIKKKEELIQNLEEEKQNKRNKLFPSYPVKEHILTEEEYYDSLSIKERNRYFSLETEAAVIGKAIHPNGPFNKARKKLSAVINNPNKVEGNGRDTIIYNHIPTVSEENVNDIFFELQAKHRSIQAELNSIKNKCQEAIKQETLKVQNKFDSDLHNYRVTVEKINNDLDKEYDEKINAVNKLKIVIPNELKLIYEEIQKLGK